VARVVRIGNKPAGGTWMAGSNAWAQAANPRTALNRAPCQRGFTPVGSFAEANAFSAVIVAA
jgi:hypothetical protein